MRFGLLILFFFFNFLFQADEFPPAPLTTDGGRAGLRGGRRRLPEGPGWTERAAHLPLVPVSAKGLGIWGWGAAGIRDLGMRG